MKRKPINIKSLFLPLIAVVLLLAIILTFMRSSVEVEAQVIQYQPLAETIQSSGVTRVKDSYIVLAPFSGQVLPNELQPGDFVTKDETVVAKIVLADPAPLGEVELKDARSQLEEAKAKVELSKSAHNDAVNKAKFAAEELEKHRMLYTRKVISNLAYKQSQQELSAANLNVAQTDAERVSAEASLVRAQNKLNVGNVVNSAYDKTVIPIYAPSNGQILNISSLSYYSVNEGSELLEIGDLQNNLEVFDEIASIDAVKIRPGNRVEIDGWGGSTKLEGKVELVYPTGSTKLSALGVAEQKVGVVIKIITPKELYRGLGNGYHVNTEIVVWEKQDALVVPASALFLVGDAWSVFRVKQGDLERVEVKIAHNNGEYAEVISGLNENDMVVLYPQPNLEDGARVKVHSVTKF